MILAIDSAGSTAAVAVGDRQAVRYTCQLNSGRTHSEQLLPMVVSAMDILGLTFKDLEAVAVTSGPGSFTGLRIGMATAKGLAQGARLPFIAVPTLDVLAENGRGFHGLVCPILNARRQEVYTAVYRDNGAGMIRLNPFQALPLEILIHDLPANEPVFFTGDGVDAYATMISDLLETRAHLSEGYRRYVAGDALVKKAYERLDGQGADDLYLSQPVYLRQSEAVVRWEAMHPGASLED